MTGEVLVAENVEIDMETLAKAHSCRIPHLDRFSALCEMRRIVVKALSPEDRKRFKEYQEQENPCKGGE